MVNLLLPSDSFVYSRLYNLNCSCTRHSCNLQKQKMSSIQRLESTEIYGCIYLIYSAGHSTSYTFFSLHQLNLSTGCGVHELSWGSLCEKAMTEESNSQEDEGVDVDHVPPQRLLRGVRELPLQLGFFFFGQFDRLVLFQPTEAHYQPLAQTWWF